ncbi:MAG: hypothetical protein WCK11_03570 [Candidatus Falkowbacteria bacterium]
MLRKDWKKIVGVSDTNRRKHLVNATVEELLASQSKFVLVDNTTTLQLTPKELFSLLSLTTAKAAIETLDGMGISYQLIKFIGICGGYNDAVPVHTVINGALVFVASRISDGDTVDHLGREYAVVWNFFTKPGKYSDEYGFIMVPTS